MEPMDLPIELSGSFSELRSVSFHSGIDIRVINRPNRKVYAIGNGYISRIKVEPGGYGNALYITHPEGYVSVYAHLDFFTKDIAELIKSIQYKNKKFHNDVYFPKDSLIVKKGDIIGIAGNTGYSFGAHLHFEIRDAVTEEPIDPLLFGFRVKDISPPVFNELKLYSHGNSMINHKNNDLILKTTRQSTGKYTISSVPEVSGAISFGFEITDKQNQSNPNRLGLKSIKVFADDSLFAEIRFEKLNFTTVRHQLAFIDYPEREKSKKRFQRTWKKPGNESEIYYFLQNDGILLTNESRLYNIRCMIEDIGGNKAELSFTIKGKPFSDYNPEKQCSSNETLIKHNTEKVWDGISTQVIFHKNTLFSDECISIAESRNIYSLPSIQVLCNEVISKPFSIRFKCDTVPLDFKKMVIARVGLKESLNGITTTFSDGWFEGESRNFGDFVLTLDTIPPLIQPLNIPSNGDISATKRLRFKVTDDISGIYSYNAFIDDQWVLLEYSLKDDEMFYIVDERMPTSQCRFKIVVYDQCNNVSIKEFDLKR